MANPFYVDPTAGFNTGAQLGQLGGSLAGLGSMLDQKRQQANQTERLQAGQSAVRSAFESGNPDDIANVMIDYPELASQVQGAMQFKSDATKQNLVSSARDVVANPSNAQNILTERIKTINAEGGDPTESILALKQLQEDPDGFLQGAKNVFATYDPEGFKSFSLAQPELPKSMTEYQSQMVRQKDAQQNIRELELEDKKLDRQLKRETDELKRQEIQSRIEQNKSEISQAKETEEQSNQDAINFSNEVIDLAEGLANDPKLDDITGPVSTMLPTISGASQDLINKAERLESMLTKENLGLMSGVLTDKDIQMLRSISSGINVSEGGIKGSYKGTKKRLQQIADKLKSGLQKTQPKQQSKSINWSDM